MRSTPGGACWNKSCFPRFIYTVGPRFHTFSSCLHPRAMFNRDRGELFVYVYTAFRAGGEIEGSKSLSNYIQKLGHCGSTHCGWRNLGGTFHRLLENILQSCNPACRLAPVYSSLRGARGMEDTKTAGLGKRNKAIAHGGSAGWRKISFKNLRDNGTSKESGAAPALLSLPSERSNAGRQAEVQLTA